MNAPLSYWRFRLTSAVRWYFRASTRYDVHSPLLNEFLREVYRDQREYHAFMLIDGVRKFWRGRRGSVKLLSHGAPSKTTSKRERSAASLVATNAIDDREGRLLFRMAVWLRAKFIIEFGTNAGISTLYLHFADTRARLDTVEANPEVAALAKTTFKEAGAANTINPYVMTFEKYLWRQQEPGTPGAPEEEKVDLFFLDGDHRYQPTLDYVNRLLPRTRTTSVFVIADIHWSEGMERVWEELKELPQVTASVDMYHFGLLFFRPELNGPHVTLIPTRYKPWRVGFF